MHYSNGYPIDLSFYKHFWGKATADFQMLVQVGSGEHFVTIDTLTKADGGQTSAESPWTLHNNALIGIDEVAQLRFRVQNPTGMIDPSLDDVDIKAGLPHIKFESVLNPTSDECLHIGEVLDRSTYQNQ